MFSTSVYGVDPYVDQFEKAATAKKDRVLKNEGQRLKNVATARLESKGIKVNPGTIKRELKKAIQVGRTSTASAGVFDQELQGEGKIRREGKRQKVCLIA